MTGLEQALAAAVSRREVGRHVSIALGAFRGPATATVATCRGTEHASPPDAHTLFQIGSITKVFTALALADAVGRGEVSLDTPLSTYLPEARRAGDDGKPVTLGHLATHTSGLPRLPRGLRGQAWRHRSDPYRSFTTDDLLAALAQVRLRSAPGVKVRYSNFGAALLGEALSRCTGMPYGQLVRERLTLPMGLIDTVIRPGPEQRGRTAQGHGRSRRPVPAWDLGGMPGAGALYSSVDDMLRFLRVNAHPECSPLADAVRRTQEPRATVNRWVRVGLGWFESPVRKTAPRMLWHNGGTGGFCSYAAVVASLDIGVVVLSDTARPVDSIGVRLLRQLAET